MWKTRSHDEAFFLLSRRSQPASLEPARPQPPRLSLVSPQRSPIPPQRSQPARSLLVMWHLLSLDAPTVAAVWTAFIARCCGLRLPWTSPAAMFVAVWMLYAADRLLDARPQPNGEFPPHLEERHRFHHRHRRAFVAVVAAVSVVLAALLHQLDSRVIHLYVLLATLLAAWLLAIHTRPLPNDEVRRLPKELAVGLFFPAAIFVPAVARLPGLRLELLPAAILFAAVCSMNCLFLYAWENPAPKLQAHWTTRWACGHLPRLSAVAIGMAICTVALAARRLLLRADMLPALACGVSVALLWGLHLLRRALAPMPLRAFADLVLLTPLLLLPWLPR